MREKERILTWGGGRGRKRKGEKEEMEEVGAGWRGNEEKERKSKR